MAARNPGRYLAPVAIIAVGVTAGLIVRDHLQSHRPAAPPVTHQLSSSRDLAATPQFYVIKRGDSLSSISVKTHVPIATLEALNRSIDPNSLPTGQRIRLRP